MMGGVGWFGGRRTAGTAAYGKWIGLGLTVVAMFEGIRIEGLGAAGAFHRGGL